MLGLGTKGFRCSAHFLGYIDGSLWVVWILEEEFLCYFLLSGGYGVFVQGNFVFLNQLATHRGLASYNISAAGDSMHL